MDERFTEAELKALLRQTATRVNSEVAHIASHFRFEPGNETASCPFFGAGKPLTLDLLESGRYGIAGALGL